MTTFTIQSPLDMHLHLRDGDMLQTVAPLSARTFAGAVIMPNLVPPVDSLEACVSYRKRVISACAGHQFEPLMTLFFRNYSKEELRAARDHIFAIKLYPAGITTNSDSGVSSLERALPTIGHLEELGIPLLIHGETDDFVMDREAAFLPTYDMLARRFPALRIVMEHITTADAVKLLDAHDNVFATVTLHHLLITLDDVAGGFLQPHLFCKPIAKRPEDREALLQAALRAHPKVMFGSDSAPHPVSKKECCGCAAGVFTAPIALEILTGLFEKYEALENLETFVSKNAQRVHSLQPPKKRITLERRERRIPARYGDVVPMWAEQLIPWTVSSVS